MNKNNYAGRTSTMNENLRIWNERGDKVVMCGDNSVLLADEIGGLIAYDNGIRHFLSWANISSPFTYATPKPDKSKWLWYWESWIDDELWSPTRARTEVEAKADWGDKCRKSIILACNGPFDPKTFELIEVEK